MACVGVYTGHNLYIRMEGDNLMKSITYGEVTLNEIAHIIADKVGNDHTGGEYNLIIGTDSQNFSDTKIVVVVALQHVGHGGVFFYDITRVRRIDNIKQKLITETTLSLEVATNLIAEFDKVFDETGFDYTTKLNFGIHVDAGENGPTKKVIPEIVSYIKSYGFDATVKPDSFVASSIADKYSK